ncbi:cytochrome P450 [Nocardia coffeae]|uniref:cytochrome P450 n=1 Tax=Nocardia coffeae TaxID=2873381 RepID=UPI0027DEB4F5|nr:cytochrome P450 [Nocardia coffeae]
MNSPQPTKFQRPDASSAVDIGAVEERVPMHTQEFAQNPHGYFQFMRDYYGDLPLIPVWIAEGIPATLVIKYETARRILHDPAHFSADPRTWQTKLPTDRRLDFLPMVEWRSNALRSNGDSPEHKRYREATQYALSKVNQFALLDQLEYEAHNLINAFCAEGATQDQPLDLIQHYVAPLTFTMLNYMVGSPPEIMARIAKASADLFEGQDTVETNAQFASALLDLITLRRTEPGDDITTRLIAHESELTDEEIAQQLVTCLSAGTQGPGDLAASTIKLLLTTPVHERPLTKTALNQTLATDPPMANYQITYPRQPIAIDGVWLPADEPVIVSLMACCTDPMINNGDYHSDGWHAGFGFGPHECPNDAKSISLQIVHGLIDWLFDILPEIQLAVPAESLVWRPGPFAHGLLTLPVTFPRTPPMMPTRRPPTSQYSG